MYIKYYTSSFSFHIVMVKIRFTIDAYAGSWRN
jgi:hypothetical protein